MNINRRTFIKGSVSLGVAAFAATAFHIRNKSVKEVAELITNATEQTGDVLVIGGGIAAVFAATRAAKNGASVMMVDKGSVGRSGLTPFANQFRVFDADAGDDRDQWIEDWTTVTGGIHHPAYLDNFLDYSKATYEELEGWGATDVGFGNVLRSKVTEEGVTVTERTMIISLLEKDGQVAGAVGFNLDTEEAVVFKAKAVILCTGAGAFKPNGFQVRSLTSDGDAMAYRIGAKISGKEFVDTHSTNSETPAYCWGSWKDMWKTGITKGTGGPEVDGRGLDMSSYIMAHEGSVPVTMGGGAPPDSADSAGGPPSGDSSGGPISGAETDSDGSTDAKAQARPGSSDGDVIGGASAGMGVHKAEGLYPEDDKCGTNIIGLYAAGDCLSTMLAGTEYVGVNGTAVAGSACQGALAGETAAEFVKTAESIDISDETIESIKTDMFAARELESGFDPAWVTQVLKYNTIPYYMLYIKKEDRLQAALNNVMYLQSEYGDRMVASDAHELRLVHETKNMLLNAEMKLRASLYRTETRGNHYREDFSDTNDTDWLAWVILQKGSDDTMKLSKVMVNG